jgi:uncharacterized delta-60 repeat protein
MLHTPLTKRNASQQYFDASLRPRLKKLMLFSVAAMVCALLLINIFGAEAAVRDLGAKLNSSSPPATGTVSFSADSYRVDERAGNATITLKRTGGTDNKVVAKVTLTDVTTSPADYYTPGALDVSFNYGSGKGPSSAIFALALQPDGKIIVGGDFTRFNSDSNVSDGVVRLNPDGTLDTSFNYGPGARGTNNLTDLRAVTALALQPDGKILIGGSFTSYNGDANASDCVARLNPDGTLDTSFNYGSQSGVSGARFLTNPLIVPLPVHTLALQPDGKIIIGGRFSHYNGDEAAGDGVARLNPDGTLDTSFNYGSTELFNFVEFYATALQPDGKVLIGGHFENFNGDPNVSHNIARLNPDGTLDTSFNYGSGKGTDFPPLRTLVLQPDGQILIGGDFLKYNGDTKTSHQVARLNTDGTLDTSFNYGSGKGANNVVTSLVLQPDGQIIVGGDFFRFNGDSNIGENIVRLRGDLLVTWEAGDAADKVIQIPITADDDDERDETFTLALIPLLGGASTGAPSTATVTITDNNLTISEVSGTSIERHPASLRAKLTDAGAPLSGKTVRFKLGSTDVGQVTTDVNGVATLSNVSTGFRGAGTYPSDVTAIFDGDEAFFPSTRSGPLTVIPRMVQLSTGSYSVGEGAGRVLITVARNDSTGTASVQYATSDAAGLTPCNVNTGDASARCDYMAGSGTLSFAAGEFSKTFTIPFINDVYVEGNETFTVTLFNPTGIGLGTPSSATVTITDDDTTPGAANPIDTREFLVRQLYLDFLNREPDPPGQAAWLNRLNTCPQPGETIQNCDEIEIASAFFRSAESFDRSYFIYKFYEGSLLRQPQYDEYQNDLRRLTGFLTTEELEQRKREFAEEFVNRAEFHSLYDSFGSGQPFVDAVLARVGSARPGVGAATIVTANRVNVINRLAAGQITRGQALRELMESGEVSQRFYNKAFVVVGYFSFLRRNPDAAYLQWINLLNTTGDYREVIRGLMQSPEFRSRFGPM